MTRRWIMAAVGAALLGALLAFVVYSSRGSQQDLPVVDDPAAIDDIHLQLPELAAAEWVERWEPDRAFNGYTLVFYQRRVPMLIDMSGEIVHAWPRVRVVGRARLSTVGTLLVIGHDDLIKEYDWDGRLLWYHRLPEEDDFPHHDVIWTESGNVLVLARDRDGEADYLQEVSHSGEVVWQWRSSDYLDSDFPDWDRESDDPTHINSIRELAPNRWFDDGDERFRPGNILVSARNLNTVFIIDKRSGDVVWQYARRLDRQHEAVMIPEGQLGAGLVLLFNNGLENVYAYRRSILQAVNPLNGSVVWSFRHPYFFSAVAGSQQVLPNGNLLVASSHGGRAFEITPEGRIVWQWIPPYLPMRPERYRYDHCPQMADLKRAEPERIRSRLKHAFVDQELHNFAVSGEYEDRTINGKKRSIILPEIRCRELIVPHGAIIGLSYGLDKDRLGRSKLSARFRFTLRPVAADNPGGGEATVLHEDVVASDSDDLWRRKWIRLGPPPYRRVELCVDVEVDGKVKAGRVQKIVAVENIRIDSRDRPRLPKEFRKWRLTPQERKIQEQQLEALGYVN
jgi:outer membrane protein assembly factor BamB